jgi:PTH1 family peptidyl-tRNA hydrolase
LDYFAKRTTFISNRQTGCQNTNLKEEPFPLKPNTYMNLSGKAVQYWMDKENISLENIFVITDDLNLSFGTIRIRPKGSDGGHNGLKTLT